MEVCHDGAIATHTVTLIVDPAHPDPAAIAEAASCLRSGGLVAFPTETVYGLGAHALDAAAVQRIFTAKERPANDPLIVHVARIEQVHAVATRVSEDAMRLAAQFWPGPLTLVLPRTPAVPDVVTAGLDTVGVRVPSHPVARALLAAAGVPVAAPSANLFSRPSPTRAAHVLDDLDGRVDLVLDGGVTHLGIESTVLDLSGEFPTVLRPGGVSVEALRQVLATVRTRDRAQGLDDPAAMRAPGMLSKHYSPRAPLTLYEGEPQRALARLQADAAAARASGRIVGVLDFGSEPDLTRVAVELYDALRAQDALGAELILVRGCAATPGLGVAIQDRLRRAAAGRIVRA